MPTRQLIVNADDLGLHPRIDEGILEAHARGIVTSATVLVTGRTAADAVAQARSEGLALGIHLCLSTGLPCAAPPSEVPRLAPEGRFRAGWAEVAAAWARGTIPGDEVARELEAQVDRARALGMDPDHLDVHQHLHLLPGLTGLVEALAARHGLPLRWPAAWPRPGWVRRPGAALKAALLTTLGARPRRRPDVTRVAAVGVFESGWLDEAALLRLVKALPSGLGELVCHPGREPGVVPEDPTWRYGWEDELAALTSPRVREALRRRGVELLTYREARR